MGRWKGTERAISPACGFLGWHLRKVGLHWEKTVCLLQYLGAEKERVGCQGIPVELQTSPGGFAGAVGTWKRAVRTG